MVINLRQNIDTNVDGKTIKTELVSVGGNLLSKMSTFNMDEMPPEIEHVSNCDIVIRVFFRFFCCFCKNLDAFKKEKNDQKYQLFKKGTKYIKTFIGKHKLLHYMDFLTYIRKMQDIDLLKYLLLTTDQIKIFNFVSKPSLDNNKLDIFSRIEAKNECYYDKFFNRDEIEKTHESYKNLNKDPENLVNRRLLNLADMEIDALSKDS